MKRLCIAVIVLSFFGFGPLKSFFQNFTSNTQPIGESLLQKIKDSSDVLPFKEPVSKEENYLVIQSNDIESSPSINSALIVRRDLVQNKLSVGSIDSVPQNWSGDIQKLKTMVQNDYGLKINHCFVINSEGTARIIDLIVPDGIPTDKSFGEADPVPQVLHGKDVMELLSQYQASPIHKQELIALLSSLKEQVQEDHSIQEWITLAPSLVNEAFKSIQSDAGKSELIELGLSVITSPVETIEPFQFVEGDQGESKEVNIDLPADGQKSIVN